MAAGVLAVAHGLGLAIPEDLSVVGFDDVPLASQVWPALTTIRQPIPAMAAQAAELLLRQLRGEPYDRSGHVVESALMFRQSHGPSRERERPRAQSTPRQRIACSEESTRRLGSCCCVNSLTLAISARASHATSRASFSGKPDTRLQVGTSSSLHTVPQARSRLGDAVQHRSERSHPCFSARV